MVLNRNSILTQLVSHYLQASLHSLSPRFCRPSSSKLLGSSHASKPFLTTGQSSSVTLNHAVSLHFPLQMMCFLVQASAHQSLIRLMEESKDTYRNVPSDTNPILSAAAKLGAFSALAFHSTR